MTDSKKKPAKKSAAKKAGVFDVSKPGAPGLSASATSRPVIIKNKTVTDPMMITPDKVTSGDDERQTAPPISATRKTVIQPLHDSLEAATIDTLVTAHTSVPPVDKSEFKPESELEPVEPPKLPVEKPDATEASVDKTSADESTKAKTLATEPAADDPKPAPLKEAKTAEDVKKPEQVMVSPAEPEPAVPADRDKREEETEVARERAARLEKLIEDEAYFLPIETLEQRRSRKVAIIGLLLIILLAAAWYNMALDANLLPNTYNLPHTSFFDVT